jgi:hypothetical protein
MMLSILSHIVERWFWMKNKNSIVRMTLANVHGDEGANG